MDEELANKTVTIKWLKDKWGIDYNDKRMIVDILKEKHQNRMGKIKDIELDTDLRALNAKAKKLSNKSVFASYIYVNTKRMIEDIDKK